MEGANPMERTGLCLLSVRCAFSNLPFCILNGHLEIPPPLVRALRQSAIVQVERQGGLEALLLRRIGTVSEICVVVVNVVYEDIDGQRPKPLITRQITAPYIYFRHIG